MKTFLELTEETNKKLYMFFGRMNPPTKGHEDHIKTMIRMAEKDNADYIIIASHSQDAKRNPLSPDTKLKHLKRAFPGVKIIASSKDKPTILYHATDAAKAGYTHLVVVTGDDRVPEFEKLLKYFNGKSADPVGRKLEHEGYKFKQIVVKSTGARKIGVSGTDMRQHAQKNDFKSFLKNLASNLQLNTGHAKELFKDVRRGMGLNEDNTRGLFKAIFVTGGPGSGKDVIIREAIAESKAVELNSSQAFAYLMDKKQLSEKSNDYRKEAIRTRGPLIINGPADDINKISTIKEELEELGYSTTMVFVDTTNEASQARNEKLSKMIAESVRQEKWKKSQDCKEAYSNMFSNMTVINNSGTLQSIEEDVTETYINLTNFIESNAFSITAYVWLESHDKLNINQAKILIGEESDKKNSRFIQRFQEKRTSGFGKTGGTGQRAENPGDISPDNRAGDPNVDNIKWDASKKRGGYTFRTYTEDKEPNIQFYPEPKESRFSKDNDKEKSGKKGRLSPSAGRVQQNNGLGAEYDSRAGGQGAAAGAGLGNQTYSEDIGPTASNADVINFSGMTGGPKPNPLESNPKNFNKFRKNIKEWNGFQNDVDSGVGGTLGGSSNKEPMENPKDKVGYTYQVIKNKKKTGANK